MTDGVDSPGSGRPGPVRTCVGCRERAAKTDLLRLVVSSDTDPPRVVPDPTGRRPGRGASLHPRLACLDLAVRRRAFARAFRLAGPLDLDEVRQYVETSQHDQHDQHDQQDQHDLQGPSTPQTKAATTDERSMSQQR
ncbi:MAG: YlxR family protein [Actinomycetes bacterium]